MRRVVVITTSYPTDANDPQGHFVAAEVRGLCEDAQVTVLAPGRERMALGAERVVGLDGGDAFGFPGALSRIGEQIWRVLPAAQFVMSAIHWLRSQPPPSELVAHFLLPCGVPIATRGRASRETQLEVVVHGSDARLFAQFPLGQGFLARELLRTDARLRFVSEQLRSLVLGAIPLRERQRLEARSRVQACVIDTGGIPTKAAARVALGLDPSAPVALIVSRLLPSKRIEVALRACSLIPDLQVIVVGDGPSRQRLAVAFPGASFVGHTPRPQALAYISAADVLVSASLEEGSPSVVREARALGTQVVCLEAGDLALWAARDPGLQVLPSSIAALKN